MLLRATHVLVLAFTASLAGACAKDSPAGSSASATPTEPTAGLTRIPDPSLVCMINNTYMGKPQIPVEVDGKTYFGCCPMCKERLNNEPGSRVAVDPVTHETVDKATAVLAQDAEGTVLYFASEQSLGRYRGKP